MSDFFDDMAGVAAELLLPSDLGGLGAATGSIVFVRFTPVAPTNPWETPPDPVREELTVRAQAFGVGKELVGAPVENGGQIVAGDMYVISERISGGWSVGMGIELDGRMTTVLSVKRIPEAGIVSAYKFIVRA